MKRMLDNREASEKQASTRMTRNRVTADVLTYLLERRTMPAKDQSIKDIAEQHCIIMQRQLAVIVWLKTEPQVRQPLFLHRFHTPGTPEGTLSRTCRP